jgi:hypothetical protein
VEGVIMSVDGTNSGGSSTNSCGCCGCLFTIVFGIILISLLAGKFTINDQTWNLDLIPPGLHSTPTEELEKPTVEAVKKEVTPEMNPPSTDPAKERKEW